MLMPVFNFSIDNHYDYSAVVSDICF